MEDSIRVLIADDHPLFRDGMRGLLGSLADMEVVGEASSGEQAIELARELQPDVILMDIKMPGINGIEATREILHASPRIGVLVVTMFEDDDSVFAAMRTGARGYLLKDSSGQEVGHAIRAVASGEAIFGPGVAHRLISFFSARALPCRGAPSQSLPDAKKRSSPWLPRARATNR
jgi:DNA-binding NarL/FixJ family response regulator